MVWVAPATPPRVWRQDQLPPGARLVCLPGEGNCVAHWLDYGSLLGAVRTPGKMVPWDYDVDMAVYAPHWPPGGVPASEADGNQNIWTNMKNPSNYPNQYTHELPRTGRRSFDIAKPINLI